MHGFLPYILLRPLETQDFEDRHTMMIILGIDL